MKFIEASLENGFRALLEQEGFPHHLGNALARSTEEV
jgi:hypothetical protein